MRLFEVTVISCTARYAKSITFSGCPIANAALPPLWPVSVEAVAYPSCSADAIAAKLMVPAQPPFPTASNFPFQFSDGSQTSISISESEDGFSTAATRHRAGSASGGGAGAGPRPPAAAAGAPPAGVGIV